MEPVPVGRPPSFDREDVIARATLVFWKHGYDATSIAMLTKAMGIGSPSLYAAFGDKRALFEHALAHYAKSHGSFMSELRSERGAFAAIEGMLRTAASMFTEKDHPPGCLVITAATNCSPDSAAVEKRLRSFRSSTVRALEETIEADKSLGRHVDAHALALFYSAVLQGMSAQARDGATRKELEEIVTAALRSWPHTLRAGTRARE